MIYGVDDQSLMIRVVGACANRRGGAVAPPGFESVVGTIIRARTGWRARQPHELTEM